MIIMATLIVALIAAIGCVIVVAFGWMLTLASDKGLPEWTIIMVVMTISFIGGMALALL